MINKKVKNRILKRVAKGESTLDAIADEFGVSKGAIYKWRKKEDAAKIAPLKEYRPRNRKMALLIETAINLCLGMEIPPKTFVEQMAKEVRARKIICQGED